jgi:iron complex outermembrane recepter protein
MKARRHKNVMAGGERANPSYYARGLRKRNITVAALVLFGGAAHAQSAGSANGPAATEDGRAPQTARPANSAGANQQLNPVLVTGEREKETATSPVDGYVARRSATGTKTDTPIIENPQSISVITADQIQAQAAQTVGEALRYTPGVVGEQFGGLDSTVDYYTVRGFQQTMPFVDGLSTQTFFTVLSPTYDTYGLERIDVLRGPSSVLYGQNVPGGMVNLVTKRPTADPLHEASIEVGSRGLIGGRVDLSGPVNKDGTLLYRFTADSSSESTQTAFVQDKHIYVAPALTWKPNADTTFTLLSHFSYRDTGRQNVDLPSIGTLYGSPFGRIGTGTFLGEPEFNEYRRTDEAIGYELEHRFSDILTVRQNLRYSHTHLNQKVVGDAGLEDDLQTLDRYAYAARASSNVFTVDNQAQFKFGTGPVEHTLLVGLDYTRSVDSWDELDALEVPSINAYAPVYSGASSIVLPDAPDYSVHDSLNQLGLYAQDQIRFGKLVATLGVRQDWTSTKQYDNIAGTNVQDNDANRFTYRAGLVYLFDSGFAPYVNYATSFQPGLGATFDGSALKPTTGQSVEVGVKFQPKNQKSFAMLSLYNIKQKNVVEPDFDHPDGNFVVQTGGVRVRGIELSGVADLGSGLSLTAAYTYMDGKITDSDQGYAGNRAANVPHNMASLWLDKTLQTGPLKGLGFGGGIRYIGSQFGDQANTLKLASTTLVDAALHYDIPHWRFSVNAQNLFDRIYVNCQGDTYCSYGLRRSVIGRATYQW